MKKPLPPRVGSSRVARACADGEHRFFGRDLFADLLPNTSMSALLFLSVTGRLPTPAQGTLLDRLAVVTSVADGRIWPLKLTRLGSAYGSVLPGFAIGQLAIEGETIGMWPVSRAAAQLEAFARVRNDAEARAHVDAIARFIGFGVPLRPQDERVLALREYLGPAARGKFHRAHLRLAALVRESRKLEPNIVSLVASLLLDMGCTPAQAGAMAFFSNMNVFVAHAFESAQLPDPLLRDAGDAVTYRGVAARTSERKARARKPRNGR